MVNGIVVDAVWDVNWVTWQCPWEREMGSLDRVVGGGAWPSEEVTLAPSPEESAMHIARSKIGDVICRAQCKVFFTQKLLRSSRQELKAEHKAKHRAFPSRMGGEGP